MRQRMKSSLFGFTPIDPVKRYKMITKNLWEGDPEGHSEAAKLGWELRRLGFERKYHDRNIWEKFDKKDQTVRQIRINYRGDDSKYYISDITWKGKKGYVGGADDITMFGKIIKDKNSGSYKTLEDAKKMIFIYATLGD